MTLVAKQINVSVNVHISLTKLENIPVHHQLGDSSYRVVLKVDGNEYGSAPITRKSAVMGLKDTFTLPIMISSRLELQLVCLHYKVRKSHIIGEAAMQVLEIARHEDVTIKWVKPMNPKQGSTVAHNLGSITIRMEVDNTFPSPEVVVKGGSAMAALGTVIHGLNRDLGHYPPQWATLLVSLTALVKLTGAFAEIDPKAKVAFGAVSFAFKMVTMQVLRDERINGLVGSMANLYSFVHDANALDKIRSLEGTVLRLIQQTTECAYFITEYSKTDSFVQRAVLSTISNVDAVISAFEATFGELKIEFIMGAALQTALISVRILDKVDNITNLIHVDKLPYMKGAGFDPSRVCLRGTCTSIIDVISNWIITGSIRDQTITPRIFLLLGGPRCGKSAISHTITQRLRSENRLGSAVFFDKDVADRNSPHILFSTMARRLAAFDNAIKDAIARAIDRDPDLPFAAIELQFQDLILNPVRPLTLIGPVVVIIDGLDECKERDRFLRIIAREFVHLPSNFRILITSRPEPDIVSSLKGLDHCHIQEMTFDDGNPVTEIHTYISEQLSTLEMVKPNLFNGEYTRAEIENQLASRHVGLNIWATTACKFLSVIPDDTAKVFFDTLSLRPTSKDPETTMDHLYHSIIYTISRLTSNDADLHGLGREAIFGILALAKPGISHITDPNDFSWQGTGKELHPVDILFRIGCIHSQLDNGLQRSLVFDRLFESYITDKRRCTIINRESLVEDCLDFMNELLAYNMLSVEDESLLNSEIPEKDRRIRTRVPQMLQYAAQYWAMHLADIEPSEIIMEKLHEFLFEHLLHWIELASLLGLFHTVLPSLESLDRWLKRYKAGLDFNTMVYDAICFARASSEVISDIALHTYISALTFTPHQTLLYQNYCNADSVQRPEVLEGAQKIWSYHRTLEGHRAEAVKSVAFSHDGSLIASAADDHTIRLWDAQTCLVVKTIETIAYVLAIVFSPDDFEIASGSSDKTVCIWDTHTGQLLFEPLRGHTTLVTSVAYSSSGFHIASGSMNGEIRIWDAKTGRGVGIVGHSDSICRIIFSPSELQFASGSWDGTVCLWDLKKQRRMGEPMLYGHRVYDVSWSPDGSLIAGSGTRSVALWDTHTREMLRKLEYPGASILVIAFSTDSCQLLGGSAHRILHLYDVKTGRRIADLNGHRKTISSVAVSPDGLKFISGSWDSTICLWDISPYHNLHPPMMSRPQPTSFSPAPYSVDANTVMGISTDGWIYVSDRKRYLWVPLQYRGNLSVNSDSLAIRYKTGRLIRDYDGGELKEEETVIKIR